MSSSSHAPAPWFRARALALAARMLAATWRVERPAWPVRGPAVAAFLHGEQLPLILTHRGLPFHGMASRSRDGALLAAVLRALGFGVVRGSSSRGGATALLEALSVLRAGGTVGLAVDGPRGPAGSVAPGAAALAHRVGAPIVVVRVQGAGWRARSWDRFLVPWPFARVVVHYHVCGSDAPLREWLDPADATPAAPAGASGARA